MTLRQVFNNTGEDVLWLILGAPRNELGAQAQQSVTRKQAIAALEANLQLRPGTFVRVGA